MAEPAQIAVSMAAIHKRFGAVAANDDVCLRVAAGTVHGIVGENGAGKSTLMSILYGFYQADSGQIAVFGQPANIRNADDAIALGIGMVHQHFMLVDTLTALENVMLPLELANRRDARKASSEMLERVGLSQRLGHYPKVLSGGEQQRVALARAFVVQPAVLLADEPTGSLDFATGESVMALMFALNRELGTTLVLVTHDKAIAERCQRCITIEAGQVVPTNVVDARQ